MVASKTDEQKLTECERVKALHRQRRAAGLCINDGPRSKMRHGPPYRGGRCRACWKKKLDAEVAAYDKRRRSNMGDG